MMIVDDFLPVSEVSHVVAPSSARRKRSRDSPSRRYARRRRPRARPPVS